MKLGTKAKEAMKQIGRMMHIDVLLRGLWHKTSRYRLHISNQELAWRQQAELEAENRRQEDEARLQVQIEAEQKELARQQLEIQQHSNHILRLAQSVKAALDTEDSVRVYQYFYLDQKGEQCYNGGAERYIRDLAALLALEHKRVTLVQMGDVESGDVWKRQADGMTIIGIPCTFFEYKEVA